MKRKSGNIVTTNTIKKANGKLVSKRGSAVNVVTDKSQNGTVDVRLRYSGKLFKLRISPSSIKEAFEKSVEATSLKNV